MEAYTGEIRIFAGNYAPSRWAFCNGPVLTVTNNEMLFSLIGTVYGGDGYTNFRLPDFRGRLPIGIGSGPSLTSRLLGDTVGEERVTLTTQQIPVHQHQLFASSVTSDSNQPEQQVVANGRHFITSGQEKERNPMGANTVGESGADEAHINVMPALALNFIICLQGYYPPRNN